MKPQVFNGTALVRRVLVGLLSGLALASTPAGSQTGGQGAAVTESSADHAPVGRLMIRYRENAKLMAQSGSSPGSERQAAAAVVTRSAALSQVDGLHYLKSVSDQLHVVELDQPLTPVQAQALMARLRADPAVEDVQIDERAHPHLLPDDPRFLAGNQWHLLSHAQAVGALNAATAWDLSTGENVVVALLDSGYRPHADLVSNILPGYDFISADNPNAYGGNIYWTANDGNARDDDARDPGDWVTQADVAARFCQHASNSSWHGTHVAGLVGAVGNNGQGGLGVAFGAKLLPVRVLGRCGGYTSDILAGARWAAGLHVPGVPLNPTPARILNLSLGVPGTCDSATQFIMDEIRDRNISIVASSGNDGATRISKPANCAGVVAVTAHNSGGQRASYANVGAGVTISAPGGDYVDPVNSTWNAGSTTPGLDAHAGVAGTSMAAPMVSGVLALMSSLRPDLPMSTLEGLLEGSARPFAPFTYCASNPDGLAAGFCGSGLVDAAAAVSAAQLAAGEQPDLVVFQRMLSGSLGPAELGSYSITVHNGGGGTATAVQVSAALSPDLNIESVTVSPVDVAFSFSSQALSATLGSLGPGQSLSITLVVRAATTGGTRTSTAETSTPDDEVSTSNNRSVFLLPGLAAPAVEPEPEPDTGGGGGGCTVAPAGQADAGLPLLALVAVLVLIWRRRRTA